MSSAEDLKAQGNQLFAAGNYEEAIMLYTKAIEANKSQPSVGDRPAVYFSNRSAARYQIGKLDAALDDATQASIIEPTWYKAFWRQSIAHTSLFHTREALYSILQAKQLMGNTPDNSVLDQLNTAWINYIEKYFGHRSRDLRVQVKWINEKLGRGVFNDTDDELEANHIILREKPIISQIRPGSHLACANCMHTKLPREDLKPHYADQWPMIYPNLEDHVWFDCERCKSSSSLSERYCSEKCRSEAAKLHHDLLCVKSPWWVEAHEHTNADLEHPMSFIVRLCEQQTPALINPLLISRMIAHIVLRISRGQGTPKAVADALEPYKLFMPSKETPREAQLVIISLRKLYHTAYAGNAQLLAVLDSVVTDALYTELHGIISRNASSLNPLSDFHIFLEGQPQINQFLLASVYNEDITPSELVQTPWMQNLTVHGTGLFAITNSINHSCEPNSQLAMCDVDHTISVVSRRIIKKAEEVTISYIDEELSYAERQAKLKQFYDFECACPKCLKEKPV